MSNLYTFADRKTIESEARLWLIKMDNDTPLSPQQTKALREWIGRSTAHREELLRLTKFWNSANCLIELAVPLHKPSTRTKLGRCATDWRVTFATFALLVILTVAVIFQWLLSSTSIANGIYVTAIGERQTKILADGSVMSINTDSQIQVQYEDGLRKIRVLRGEVHFDVAPDPGRPFEVYAGNGMVRAVGTSFSVHLLNQKVKVLVSEGKVDLSVTNSPTDMPALEGSGISATENKFNSKEIAFRKLESLNAGHSAIFSQKIDEIHKLDNETLKRKLLWQEGVLAFSGDSLDEIVREINRYTPMIIEIADPSLRNLKIGGRFKTSDINAIFEVLETSFGIQVSRLDDRHVRLFSTQNEQNP